MTIISSEQNSNGTFVVRLWRGDVSLAKTYWLFGVIGGAVLRFMSPAITYIVMSNSSNMSTFDIHALLYAWVGLVVIYSLFILVAIWRSANKYRKKFPASAGNATLAQIACVFGALVFAGSIATMFESDNTDLAILSRGGGTADQRLQYSAIIAGLNANLPRKIDAVTTLTKIDVDKGSFQYFETITAQLDSNDAFIHRMRPIMAGVLCKDKGVKDNLSEHMNYLYIYSDQDAKPIGTLLITIDDCPK